MRLREQCEVAVLLATYNGAKFIEPQIRSLQENATAFTLHWLDDHSTDDTREAVRAAASRADIPLHEWHVSEHLGLPGTFFQLLECVDADFYLFCDQDDIWQPGKIDATVANLRPDANTPVLCFSDSLVFNDERPGTLRRASAVFQKRAPGSLQDSRLFLSVPAAGQAMGFTRPLREIFIRHKDVARTYAFMHDWWMYIIAVAAGTCRMLTDVPTTLYRQHGNNVTGMFFSRNRRFLRYVATKWRLQQYLRRRISRQAEGFILAASTLPAGAKLERLIALARLVATLERRQSLPALLRLVRKGALLSSGPSRALWLATSCLFSDAGS